MILFVLRRLGLALLQLAGLIVAVFFLIRWLPADPVARFVGLNASPEAYASARASLGLDEPLWSQFAEFVGFGEPAGLLQGSLGESWVTGSPVAQEIRLVLPATLELISYSFVLAIVAGVGLGVLGALKPGGGVDKGTTAFGMFAGSQPEFAWGLILIYVFFYLLGIAPGPLGRLSPLTPMPEPITGLLTIDAVLRGDWRLLREALHFLMLPVLTLAIIVAGPIIKLTRDSMGRVLATDYIMYAHAAGLPRRVLAANALRAALAPSMTMMGILYSFMLGGAVLVESVFSLGGLGQYAVRSILAFDYPAIQGVVLVIAAISLAVYLLLDVLHAVLDPRIV